MVKNIQLFKWFSLLRLSEESISIDKMYNIHQNNLRIIYNKKGGLFIFNFYLLYIFRI